MHRAHTHRKDDDFSPNSKFDDDEYLEAKVENTIDKRFDHFEKEMKTVIVENIDKKLEKVKEELKEYSYSSKSINNNNPIESYKIAFQKEYGEWEQVSYNELSQLAIQTHGITDKRSIKNRINYLIGNNIIKQLTPNVYQILH